MKYVFVGEHAAELYLVNTREIFAARSIFRWWADRLHATYLESFGPHIMNPRTLEERAMRLGHATCHAMATALNYRTLRSFRVRGDVPLLRTVLTEAIPLFEDPDVEVPGTMLTPTTERMARADFKGHALVTAAYYVGDGVVKGPSNEPHLPAES